MNSSEDPTSTSPESPIDSFLAQPAYHAEEDSVEATTQSEPDSREVGSAWLRFRHWFTHFMFEKGPGQYSSIAPRTTDGKRTKIFFFNGNGRGR